MLRVASRLNRLFSYLMKGRLMFVPLFLQKFFVLTISICIYLYVKTLRSKGQ